MAKDTGAGGREIVDEVAQSVIARFETGLGHLGVVRSSAQAIGSHVNTLLEVTGNQGSDLDEDPLARFLQHARTIADRADRTARRLGDPKVSQSLGAMLQDLGALRDCATELRSATYLTKIVCAQNIETHGRLESFVLTLEQSAAELKEIGAAATSSVAAVRKSGLEAAETLGQLSVVFGEMVETTRADVTELERLKARHTENIDAIQAEGRDLDKTVRGAVARLIDCLQFSDAFSQRREHVVTIIAAAEESTDQANRLALERLGAAQLKAMTEDLARVTGNALDALGRIARGIAPDRLGAIDKTRDPSALWLAAARNSNAMMRGVADDGREHLDNALQLVDAVLGHVRDAVDRLEATADLNGSLENSARNAAIAASRAGEAGGGLRVLAKSVREVVLSTTDLIEGLTKGLELVRQMSDDLQAADLRAELQKLMTIQGAAKDAADRQADMLEALDAQRGALAERAGEIRAAAEHAAAAFAEAREEAPRLEALAALHDHPAPSTPPSVDLGWVEALYTMEEERVVHRTLFPQSEAAVSLPTDEDEDLDGFLL